MSNPEKDDEGVTEGSETSISWKATFSTRSGTVEAIGPGTVKIRRASDGHRYTWRLEGAQDRLLCKHLPQYVERLHQCRRGQVPQAPDKPPPVYGSNLVEHDKAVLFLKTTRNPEGVGMPAGRHGSDHKGTQMVVQFIRRNYRTRPHFLYFLALCWIQRNEVNVPTPGINHSQTHSDASNADRCGASSSPSSPLP